MGAFCRDSTQHKNQQTLMSTSFVVTQQTCAGKALMCKQLHGGCQQSDSLACPTWRVEAASNGAQHDEAVAVD